jgi:thiol:disulfide interchange protein DsbD
LLIAGYSFALEGELRWRAPMPPEISSRLALREGPDGIDWQRWTPAAVETARAEGHLVIVDFTADWCLICQVNKRLALEVPSVRARLKQTNAVALLADYTLRPDDIGEELKRFGAAGVPLVVVYPKNPNEPPIVLPQTLTPGIVLNALDRAAH